MSVHEKAAPVDKKFFTAGMKVITAVMITGLGFGLYRIIFSLSSITHLNNQFPLGLWIGADVASGVALAAGGFTTGALVYIFHRELFHAIIRPALLTAMLGYTFPLSASYGSKSSLVKLFKSQYIKNSTRLKCS